MKTVKDKSLRGPTTRDAANNLFKVIRFIGIDRKMPTKYKHAYDAYSAIVNFLVCIYMPTAFTIGYILHGSEMEISNLLTSLQAAINVHGCVMKVFILAWLLNELRKAEVIMAKLDARCVDEDEKAEIGKVAKLGNLIVVQFAIIYFIYTITTCVAAVISGTPPYDLYNPLNNWRKSTKNFAIEAATEFGLVNVTCLQQLATDSYPVVYIGILRHYVRLLLLRISKLCLDPTKSKKENTQELVNCIIDHKNIIALFDIIQTVISKTIFVQFLNSAAILSTTLVNVMIFADLSSKIASVLYIVAVVVEILPCCYYADCLMVESDEFNNAIFHANWMEQDFKFRKMLVFFLHQSQKPIALTAGKIFPINLNSFIGIAKFSFSLYTLISQMEYGQA